MNRHAKTMADDAARFLLAEIEEDIDLFSDEPDHPIFVAATLKASILRNLSEPSVKRDFMLLLLNDIRDSRRSAADDPDEDEEDREEAAEIADLAAELIEGLGNETT